MLRIGEWCGEAATSSRQPQRSPRSVVVNHLAHCLHMVQWSICCPGHVPYLHGYGRARISSTNLTQLAAELTEESAPVALLDKEAAPESAPCSKSTARTAGQPDHQHPAAFSTQVRWRGSPCSVQVISSANMCKAYATCYDCRWHSSAGQFNAIAQKVSAALSQYTIICLDEACPVLTGWSTRVALSARLWES